MHKLGFWGFLIVGLLLSCGVDKKTSINKTEIENLKLNEDHLTYLRSIYDLYLKSRQGTGFARSQKEVDAENIAKITAYLDYHGAPNHKKVGRTASSIPWMILQNYEGEGHIALREKYFPMMYEALKNKDINAEGVSHFLNKLYTLKNGKSFDMPSPFTPKDEIDSLMINLGFVKRMR